jgi:hypothetical protein
VPPTVTRLCDSCEQGRPIRSIRKRINNRPSHALDRVYIDVVIVTPKSFPGKARYSLMCTDSATIARWLWTFEKKGDVFYALQKHVRFCKTQYRRIIKEYCLDDGREYTLVQLNELAAKLGQLIRRTTLYMPEQDSPSERSIRTIIERARCATVDQDIPHFL